MLQVSLCKPVIHSWKFWVGGNLDIINQWGEPQKRWNWKFQRGNRGWGGEGEGKRGYTIFDSNLVGGKILKETMVYFWKNLHQIYKYKLHLNKTNTIYTIIIHKNESNITPYEEKCFLKITLRLFYSFWRIFQYLIS